MSDSIEAVAAEAEGAGGGESSPEIKSFVIRQGDGSIIEPWKNIKNLRGYEWIRDASTAVTADIRDVPSATYVGIQENEPVFLAGIEAPYTHYNKAVFQDDKDGKIYDIAERIVETKKVKVGDSVSLKLLGCCSIMDITKRDKSEEDEGGVGSTDDDEEEEEE